MADDTRPDRRNARGPCHYCGAPYMVREYYDPWIRQIVRDVEDHPCPAWATPEPLSDVPTDTSFITESWNTADALERWRAAEKRAMR